MRETVDCLRIGFDHEPKEDCLVCFGRGPTSDIFLNEKYYSRRQALLYIDPNSLDIICRCLSQTSLLFDDHSGSVGRWVAVGHDLGDQAILPYSNVILDLRGAHFTFRW